MVPETLRRSAAATAATVALVTISVGMTSASASPTASGYRPSVLDFAISAPAPAPLRPGESVPIDVTFWNPQPRPIQVTDLSLAVTDAVRTTPASADAGAVAPGCPGPDDYAVSRFAGDYPALVVPARGHVSLSGLGVGPERWPQLSLPGRARDGGSGPDSSVTCPETVPVLTFTGSAIPHA